MLRTPWSASNLIEGLPMNMKRIVCAALALTLLGSTAASARDWGHGGGGYGGGYRHHHGDGGAVLGFGLGILALGIIAAESDRHHDRYDDRDRYEGRDGRHDDGDRYRGDDRGDRGHDDRDGDE